MTAPVTGFYEISDASPKMKGFGTTLIMVYHSLFPGVREYSADSDGLSAMVSDGFSVDSNAYDLAKTHASQTPHSDVIKIGRFNTNNVETFTLTVASATPGDKIGVSIAGGSGSVEELQRTVPATGATTTTEATALAALINGTTARTNWSAAAAAAVITVTRSVATMPLRLRGFTPNLTFKDNTPAVGYAADFAAANAYDDDFYRLIVEGRSAAAIGAAQAFAEANGKFYVGLCADSDCVNPGSTTDALYVGKVSNLTRGPVVASRDRNGNADVALNSRVAAYAPGKASYANVSSLSGPRVDRWSATEQGAIEAKRGIAYRNFLGTSVTSDGWAPSGRYCDLTNLGDLVVARMMEGLAGLLAREVIVRLNARGRGQADSELRGVLALQEAEETILPAGGEGGWTTYVPSREELSANERAQRKLPRCEATFTTSGGVNNIAFKVLIKI